MISHVRHRLFSLFVAVVIVHLGLPTIANGQTNLGQTKLLPLPSTEAPAVPTGAEKATVVEAVAAVPLPPAGSDDTAPGLENLSVPPITPEQAERALKAGAQGKFDLPAQAQPTALILPEPSAATAGLVTSVADMARALKYDPDLIYEHILNNVDFLPFYGIKKGALGALIDSRGTAADQAELMVKLLEISAAHNPAIANPRVIQGLIDLDQARMRRYVGISGLADCETASFALRIMTAGGIPKAVTPANSTCPTTISVTHFWVRVTIAGTDVDFDPSLKTYEFQTNVDLVGASRFDFVKFLSDARTSATITTDFVQNINRANIRNNLALPARARRCVR